MDYRAANFRVPDGTDTSTLEGAKVFRIAEARAWAGAYLDIHVPSYKQRNAALGIRMKQGESQAIKSEIERVGSLCDSFEQQINACTTVEEVWAIDIRY